MDIFIQEKSLNKVEMKLNIYDRNKIEKIFNKEKKDEKLAVQKKILKGKLMNLLNKNLIVSVNDILPDVYYIYFINQYIIRCI
jgi:hypothetical protein